MIQFIDSHAVTLFLVFLVFSAIVDGMPQPAPGASLAWRWLYATLHLLAGNLSRVLRAVRPADAVVLPPEPEA